MNKEEIQCGFDLKLLLCKAVNNTKSKGSSTCVLLLINQMNKKLYSAYVGDSLYMILRYDSVKNNFNIYHKSFEQQHKFNQPYQLGTNGDYPMNALVESHDINDKDVLVIASDGLWDNIHDETILQHINQHSEHNNGLIENISNLSKSLGELAEKCSLDNSYESPFSKKAKSKGIDYIGGKEDDITIIISQMKDISQRNILNHQAEIML